MQDMQLEKGSQAAISPDMEDGWTAAKWRIMLMFVLIIQREGIHHAINRPDRFFCRRVFAGPKQREHLEHSSVFQMHLHHTCEGAASACRVHLISLFLVLNAAV